MLLLIKENQIGIMNKFIFIIFFSLLFTQKSISTKEFTFFYDGEKNITLSFLEKKLKQNIYSDIIDIGAESSRPFSNPVSVNEVLVTSSKTLPSLQTL